MPSLQETLTKRAKDALAEIDKRPGVFQLDPEEKGLLQGMAKGYQSFMTEAADTMLDDIERRHGLNGKMAGRMVHPGGKGRGAGAIKGVKVHHGEHGELFELASTARLSDVLQPDHQPDVSLDRWLAAVLLGDRCKDKAALDYAIEAKTVSGGTSGVLLPVGYQAEWTDNIRAQMVLNAAGMTTVTMNERTVTSSRIVSDPVAGWRAEGGALTASDPTFELQNLVARSVYVRTKTTAELAADTPNYGAQLMGVMSASLAAEIDRAGLIGLGSSNEPRGILNTVGINAYAYAGAVDTYDPLIIGVQKCLEANCPMEAVEGNAIMSPRSWAGWAALRSADGHYIARPKVLDNMVFRPTTAIPNNLGSGEDESVVLLGDFTQLVMGIRQEATVEALRLQSYGDNLLLEFIGTARIDFLVRRPASFTEITGVTIAP
jgi:HK97 family phage major capsid protein